MAADDRAYLEQLVAARTGLAPADAKARVDAVLKRADEAAAQAKRAAETARKTGATVALVGALSLMIGAFIASAGAALGGRLRDDKKGNEGALDVSSRTRRAIRNDGGRITLRPIGKGAVHLCVDMQRLFADGSPWATPWMKHVLPNVEHIVTRHPRATIFTRFIPDDHPGEGVGTWQRYYEHWSSMTLQIIGPEMADLLPQLAAFSPPAPVVDKRVYSPWTEGNLDKLLSAPWWTQWS